MLSIAAILPRDKQHARATHRRKCHTEKVVIAWPLWSEKEREAAREKGRGVMWGLYQAHAGDSSHRTGMHQNAQRRDV